MAHERWGIHSRPVAQYGYFKRPTNHERRRFVPVATVSVAGGCIRGNGSVAAASVFIANADVRSWPIAVSNNSSRIN